MIGIVFLWLCIIFFLVAKAREASKMNKANSSRQTIAQQLSETVLSRQNKDVDESFGRDGNGKAIKSDTIRSAMYSSAAASQLDSKINSRRQSGYRKLKPDSVRAGHMHIRDIRGLALEDREHDWLAQQMREEARLGNFCVDSAMDRLTLDHLKKHKMIHFD